MTKISKNIKLSVAITIAMGTAYAETGEDNPSIRPKEQSKSSDLYAQFLYWHAGETIDWAFATQQQPGMFQSTYESLAFHWDPGFRVGIGYNMQHDGWDTQASFTWFQAGATAHVEGTVTSYSLAARLSLLEPFNAAKASVNLHYNIFDFDLGRNFLLSKYFALRPSIGIKGGWINQLFHLYWKKYDAFGFINTYGKDRMENNFSGGGPKGGFTGRWCFGNLQKNTVSILGSFEAGYLWGRWSVQDHFIDNLNTSIRLNTSPRNFGALVLHSFLGLGWDFNLHSDQMHLSMQLGYEIEDWLNHLQIFTNISGSQNNDLILQGINFGVRLDF